MSPSAILAGDGTPASGTANGSPATSAAGLDVDLVDTPQVSDPWTVDKVLASTGDGRPAEDTGSPVPFFHLLERLKTTRREGWRRFDIQRGESIADHMYRMSLMSMLAPPALAARLDLARCVKMCLVHDMAEALVGDITPVDGVPKAEKNRREASTMDYVAERLLGGVHGGVPGQEIRAVWQEYEDSETLESRYVHDVDKMELLLQMVEYERRGAGQLDLGEFAYVATKVTLPETRAWAVELLREREAFWDGHRHVHGEEGVDGGVRREKRELQEQYYGGEGREEGA